MSIYVDTGGKEVEFRNFSFDKTSSTFKSEINPDTGVSLSIRTPINLDNAFEEKNFLVFFFAKNGLVESEIFQVFDKNRNCRIGWCIPVNALSSIEHDYASDIHFRRYAYAAMKFGLNSLQITTYTKRPLINDDIPLDMSEIFSESTALLVISKEKIEDNFEILRWIPGLAALGYFQLTSENPDNIRIQRPRVLNTIVHIKPISDNINELDHLKRIYLHNYPFEGKPLFQFFYLYQAIELLMELVFKKEQANLVKKIIYAQHDVNSTKEILEDAYSNTSEKRRMGLLARNYCCCEGDLSELVGNCNNLLQQLNQKEGKNLETTIYPIRNFLFHQFRNFPSSAEESLEQVIVSLSSFLPTLLGNFNDSRLIEQEPLTFAQ